MDNNSLKNKEKQVGFHWNSRARQVASKEADRLLTMNPSAFIAAPFRSHHTFHEKGDAKDHD